jgi:hypothetical protein
MPAAPRAFILAAFLSLVLAAPAHAGLATPTPVAPANGLSVDAPPAFSWAAVAGADRYEFQLAADSGMNSPVLGRGEDQFTTRNTRATVKKTFPNGTYWWRVRALAKDGTPSPWTAPRSIVKSWTAAPALQSPSQGAIMVHPTHPLVLRWSSVPRAAKYIVSIGTDPTLGTIVNPKDETSGTVYAPRATLLPPGTYYWNVTPIDSQGHRGAPSPVQSFMWTWPTTTLTRVDDLMSAAEVYDPNFSWDPIAGAAKYEVEINPSVDFAPGSKVCCANPVIGTSLSPVNVLRDNTYYWRVRAVDTSGNAGVWNNGPTFTKTFDKVPPVAGTSIKSLHMRDNLADPGTDLSGTPGYQTEVPVVRWDPVPGAASYEADVTPYTGGACDWTAPASVHWRVKTSVPFWTPLGADWINVKPYPDALPVAYDGSTKLQVGWTYCVRVRARANRDSSAQEVYGDYTYLTDGTSAEGPAFTWTGYPPGEDCGGCSYLASGHYVLPAVGSANVRTPLFTWKPIAGKQSYYVLVSRDPSFSNIVDYAFTQVPAYAPRSPLKPTTYADETTSYYWAVLPATNFNGTGAVGNPLAASPSNFQKQSTPPSQTSPAAAALIDLQPTFRWTPVEGARRYRLQVATDPTFGTLLDDVLTDSTAYTSNTSYPADTLLYWRVRGDDENLIGLTWSATGSFQRRLPAPVQSATNPGSGESIPLWTWSPITGAASYDVAVDEPDGDHSEFMDFRSAAFTAIKMTGTGVWGWRVRAEFPKALSQQLQPGAWSATRPFTRTIAEPGGASTERSGISVLLAWNVKPGAKNYRVQVSQRADFQLSLEQVDTDNTAFAPTLTLPAYLAGGTFWWRVAAMDEDKNIGDFTAAQQFTLPKSTTGGPTALTRLKLRLKLVKTKKGRRVTVTVKANGRVARGALVRVFSTGVSPRKAKTNRKGQVTFRLKKLGRGKTLMRRQLLFHAAKTGFLPASAVLKIRY